MALLRQQETARLKVGRYPDPTHIKTLLSRYARVRLNVPVDHLTAPDRRALDKLIGAASWIDRIFWKQHSDEGLSLDQVLTGAHDENSRDLKRLLRLNFGPWDNFDDDRPFWGKGRRPPGGNLYPPDLTREELESYVLRYPEEREALLNHTTLVRRKGKRLVAVPYAEAYHEELAHVAKDLIEASEFVSNMNFRNYLRARAEDLVTGSLQHSETLWINVGDSPIDIAIGPYELYDDALLGLKTSYEATVLVRQATTLDRVELQAAAGEIGRRLPGAVAPADSRRRLVAGVYDVLYAAGMTNMGGKAIAATLPNDERIRTDVGARLLLFRNVITAKFEPIVKPLATRVLRREQVGLVRQDAFLEHTLLHELAHALGTNFVCRGEKPTETTVNEALRERYSTIDECRADLVGMVMLDALTRHGVFSPDMNAAAATTFIVSSVRSLRFGAGDSYSQGGAIVLSHLLRTGAIMPGIDGRLSVDIDGVHRGVADLAATVQQIATRGDYEGAGRLIGELGSMPSEIEALRSTFSDIPIDIEFDFSESH